MDFLLDMLAVDTPLVDMSACISQAFMIVHLLPLQVFALRDGLLEKVLHLLVLSDQPLLIVLHSLELVTVATDEFASIINLLAKLGIPISLIDEVVFHVLVYLVQVVFRLEGIIGNLGFLHRLSQRLLQLCFLSGKSLKLLMDCIKSPKQACIILLQMRDVLSNVSWGACWKVHWLHGGQ